MPDFKQGLFVNDSLVVATARVLSARGIASADTDFRSVKDLLLFVPTDLSWPVRHVLRPFNSLQLALRVREARGGL